LIDFKGTIKQAINIFNNTINRQTTKNNNLMKRIILTVTLLIAILASNAQEVKFGIQYQIDIQKYIEQQSVIWYGWDFSNFKVCDQNIKTYIVKDKYIPVWIEKMNDFFPEKHVRKELNKEFFSSNPNTIQNLYKQKNFREYLTDDKFELPLDSIKAIVKRYPLTEKSGAGFVIIVENLNKPERYVTGYLTFFDINTKEVLWTTKMKGQAGGKWGPEEYYRNGLVEIYPYFFRKYYSKSIKEFTNPKLKEKKKKRTK